MECSHGMDGIRTDHPAFLSPNYLKLGIYNSFRDRYVCNIQVTPLNRDTLVPDILSRLSGVPN